MVASFPQEFRAAAPTRVAPSTAQFWGISLSIVIAGIWMAGFVIGFTQAVTLIGVIGLIATVIGMAHPTIGIFGIGILCTLDVLMREFVLTGGLLRWNTFNYVLLLAVGLSFPMMLRRRELPVRMMESLIAFLGVNLLFVGGVSGGIQHIFGAFTFFGLLIYFLRATKDEAVWEWVAVVSGVVAAFGGFIFFLQQDNLAYINKNAWAFLPLTAIFAACLAHTYRSKSKNVSTVFWALVAANVVWIVLTGSRGGMTMAASCLLYLLSGIPGISNRIMVLAGGILVAGVLVSQFTEQTEFAMQRLDKSVSSEYSMASRTSGRSDLAIGGWRMFLEHPLIGVGTGGYAQAWKNLENREGLGNYAANRASQAHSGWVKTLAEGGLPGILFLSGFVLSFLILGYNSGDRPLFFLGLLVTVTLAVAFISTEFQGKGLWFFSAGATVVMTREITRVRAEKRERRRLRAAM